MLKFKSKRLAQNLKNIKSQWAGRKLGATIVVPPDMQWWYFQEFGTATHLGSGVNGFNEDGISQQDVKASPNPDGYVIAPRLKNFLSWPLSAGGHYFDFIIGERGFRFYVPWHPGVEPKAFVRRVLKDVQRQVTDVIARTMLDSGFSFAAVESAFIEQAMKQTKETIANSMAEALEGTRAEGGKLRGQAAAAVFRAEATIEQHS